MGLTKVYLVKNEVEFLCIDKYILKNFYTKEVKIQFDHFTKYGKTHYGLRDNFNEIVIYIQTTKKSPGSQSAGWDFLFNYNRRERDEYQLVNASDVLRKTKLIQLRKKWKMKS